MKKIHSTSFSAGLTAGQREELYFALSDGLSYADATAQVYAWHQANAASPRPGVRIATRIKRPSRTSVCLWYRAAAAEQRYTIAKVVAAVSESSAPADYDEQARRALGQARYLATMEGLRVSDIATLEKNQLTRERLALDREKLTLDARQQRCTRLLDRAKALAQNAPTREASERKAASFQLQVDLVLEEIERMKYGDDYLTRSPDMRAKYTDPGRPPPSQVLGLGKLPGEE